MTTRKKSGEDSVCFMRLSFNQGKTGKTFENIPTLYSY